MLIVFTVCCWWFDSYLKLFFYIGWHYKWIVVSIGWSLYTSCSYMTSWEITSTSSFRRVKSIIEETMIPSLASLLVGVFESLIILSYPISTMFSNSSPLLLLTVHKYPVIFALKSPQIITSYFFSIIAISFHKP